MKPDAIAVVAFDCDGVMFDSSSANRAYYNHLLTHLRLPVMTKAQFDYTHMYTVDQSLAFLIQDPATLALAHQYRRQMSYLPFIEHMTPEPHLTALLDKLRPGRKTAIATNRTDTMERVLQVHHLEDQFDLVITALDVPHPKPHPDQLLVILKHFGIQPGQMLFIGDSSLDAEAAHAAQVPFVAYANPDLTAHAHIESLQQVEILLGLVS
jgi:phosphoglycolate phosphatase